MNQATPPAWAEEILRVLLPPRDRDSVGGDLIEGYRERIELSPRKAAADLWYGGRGPAHLTDVVDETMRPAHVDLWLKSNQPSLARVHDRH